MTTKRIIFERPDGGITVRVPVADKPLEEIAAKNPPGRWIATLDASELPDRAYRDAWRADPQGRIVVDPAAKARIDEERQRPTLEQRIAALEKSTPSPGDS